MTARIRTLLRRPTPEQAAVAYLDARALSAAQAITDANRERAVAALERGRR